MSDVPRRAGIYLRISSDPEGLRLGVQRQSEDCERICAQHGWEVTDVYEDNDRSAYRGKPRPEYERMLDDLRSGRINAVAVYAQDRLTRHPKELEEFFEIKEAVGDVALASVAGRTDLGTPEGQLMARIEGAVARRESDTKSQRQRRKAAQLAEQGKLGGGGTRPFGFEPDFKTIRESEAVLIRDAAERLIAGESKASILREWETKGIKTPTGKVWQHPAFRRMMTSPRIAGIRQYLGEEIGPAEWEPIIDQDTHRQLQERFKGTGAHRINRDRTYLLTGGLAVCGLCGVALVAARQNTKRSLVCASAPGKPGCGRITVVAEPVEELVGQAVIQALDGPLLAEAIRADRHEDDQDASLAHQIAAKQDALERAAVDFYTTGDIDRAQFMAATRALEAQIDSLRSKMSRTSRTRILTGLPTSRPALQTAWDQADTGWRRGLIMAVIDHITIRPATRGHNTFNPERVTITWHA